MALLLTEPAAERGADFALVDDDGAETWSDLNSRVNQLVREMVIVLAIRDNMAPSGIAPTRKNSALQRT